MMPLYKGPLKSWVWDIGLPGGIFRVLATDYQDFLTSERLVHYLEAWRIMGLSK